MQVIMYYLPAVKATIINFVQYCKKKMLKINFLLPLLIAQQKLFRFSSYLLIFKEGCPLKIPFIFDYFIRYFRIV